MASVKRLLYDTLDDLEEEKLKRFKSYLREDGPIPASVLEKANATDTADQMLDRFGPERAVKITLDILKKMNQNHLAKELENKHSEVFLTEDWMLHKFLETHKTNMKKKAKSIFEGNKENDTDLMAVYTELFITEGDMEDVNQEHEILKIDDAFKSKKTQEKPIKCNDIFTELRKNCEEKIVLTKGVAGIGKTVSVHKFILDWAEGNANQDIDCVFLLLFREINMIKDKKVNLHEFLLKFYPDLKDLGKSKLYKKCKLALLFDGLDESRLPLNFKSETLDTVEERSSVDVMFTSLVRGNLLPSALVWVTSRPAAANQIPPRYVGLFTEVQGFTDQQKEEYFRKRITDETQVSRIISHIKTNRSLYIMCHIPVFCWITATVLQNIIIKKNAETITTTLTEMYIHFLRIQMDMKCQKFDEQEEREHLEHLQLNREMILKLAKLAFKQLKKENIVFYEGDLKECGINVSKDTEFTGMIAEIFKMEDGLYKRKVFCFVHLSVQEFLAAVHVFLCYLNKNKRELRFFFEDSQTTARLKFFFRQVQFHDLTKRATDKAMQSKRGHLDLFLRFLMGISLESSQNLLKGLITHTQDTTEIIRQTTEYIKQVQNKNITDETSVNLFYCLLELKDHSLYEEIQSYLSSDEHPERDLSSSMCTVLTYILLMSEKVLDEFNPKRFTSSLNYQRLIPAVRCCRKALLCECHLTAQSCESLSSALKSSNSVLRELDLSNNDLQDSGVMLLSEGLQSPNCQVEILRLSGCMVTEKGCYYVSSALTSNPSHLRELDLSYNHPGDSGVKMLSEKLKDPYCSLDKLKYNNISMLNCHLHGLSQNQPVVNIIEYADALESQRSQSCIHTLCEIAGADRKAGKLGIQDRGAASRQIREFGRPWRSRQFRGPWQGNTDQNSLWKALEVHALEGALEERVLDGARGEWTLKGWTSPADTLEEQALGEWSLEGALTAWTLEGWTEPAETLEGILPGGKLIDRPATVCVFYSVDHGGESRIKEGLKKYACFLTLDPNTANTELSLSEDNRKVTRVRWYQPYPDHPDRFDVHLQVLCRESVCGRCYWEIEWSGDVDISVSYKSINRKGQYYKCSFGYNNQSWSLFCSSSSYSFRHNNIETDLPVKPISSRVGVYVDESAGTLSFYSVSRNTMSLIHTEHTTFTQTLCPGITVWSDSSVELC
ncbi:NACHT, LRR and PYD domains-containing protein 3-like [Garra rufa]|uniref:NACHT, LRR and PYD domains-containing protein 3-like n=1 Tax=Garra rufa TaxID=137080 RepID=UPI003CCEAB5E